jgi:hypothetical protein
MMMKIIRLNPVEMTVDVVEFLEWREAYNPSPPLTDMGDYRLKAPRE